MRFLVKTYGCQMNVHESDKISASLLSAGFKQTANKEDADIIVFNTCCIRNTAEQKILAHIGEVKHLKKANPNLAVAIVGCLSQRDGMAETIRRRFPFVNILLGTHNATQTAEAVKEYLKTGKPVIDIRKERDEPDNSNAELIAKIREDGIGYINITYGCENYCSYCIVPYVRGKLVCRELSSIIAEFKNLVETGVKKIFLLGQNVNSYLCPETKTNFPKLLQEICRIKGDFLVNFLSSHPRDFSTPLAEIIANNPKIERNIHLPMQSGCDKTLHAMNRGYTVREYEEKIAYLRKLVPNIHITTDIICGFPNETEDDFSETVETVKRINFSAAFIFPYSRRSGTAADKMPNQVDTKTKKRRTTELIEIMRREAKR